jgi:hypothetical protein
MEDIKAVYQMEMLQTLEESPKWRVFETCKGCVYVHPTDKSQMPVLYKEVKEEIFKGTFSNPEKCNGTLNGTTYFGIKFRSRKSAPYHWFSLFAFDQRIEESDVYYFKYEVDRDAYFDGFFRFAEQRVAMGARL